LLSTRLNNEREMHVPIGNRTLYDAACAVIPGGVNTSLRRISPPLVFRRAEGAIITDVEGKQYIDYHAAFGPIVLGHNHPEVNGRVAKAMQELDLLGAGTTEYEIELARKICEHVPSAERVLFCNSGSEATYQALRLARAVTGREKIIKFQGCYHGWHDSVAMNVITPAGRIGRPDPLSDGSLRAVTEKTLVCAFNDLEEVDRAVRANRDEIATIILEPVPHNIGCVLPEPGFLEGLREIATRNGILLVFDEVITGFRHGLGGYQKSSGVTPDLTTLGKAMANGFPISAVCGRREFMERFNTHPDGSTFFAGTFNGHAYACAAALATIEVLERPAAYDRLFALGERMRRGLRETVARLGIEAVVAGFGSVFLLYFMEGPVRTYTDLLRNDGERFVAHRRTMIEDGVFQFPMNLKRNHISLSHTETDIDRTLEVCESALKKLACQSAAH
jgi:glutamate-1-semialdehyde 2,1-aminomutase